MGRHAVALLGKQAYLFELGIASELFGLPRPELGIDWYTFDIIATATTHCHVLGKATLQASRSEDLLQTADIIVIPGWAMDENPCDPALLTALKAAHARGTRLFSICSGIRPIAESGLLDGFKATSHWRHCEQLARRYPRINWQPEQLYVDSHHILSSAGSAAGIDAGLYLIAEEHGQSIANQVARRLLMPPHRSGTQRQFIPGGCEQASPTRFAELQEWVQNHLEQRVTVAMMASQVAMSERNFQRRFAAVTGQTPKAWLQHLRIVRARELCEEGITDLDRIATLCGYTSADTLRSAFRRVVGLSPSAYRRQFAVRTDSHRAASLPD